MIEIQRILKKLSSSYKRIVVNKYDMFEFSNNNAYLILNGSIYNPTILIFIIMMLGKHMLNM